jgi:YjbE family integral membrane protein
MNDVLVSELVALGQVLMIDLVLAGDNAIVVGMAAAGVAPDKRRIVIFWGIAAAVVMRIAFAAVTTQLLQIVGLLLAGGILLLWVAWKLFRELREQRLEDAGADVLDDGETSEAVPRKTVRQAVWQVALADVSMSLDNVLAVAGAARDHFWVLVVGLGMSVVLMGVAATLIARVLAKHHWIAYVGLVLIGYVAVKMIYDGGLEVLRATGAG